MTPTIVPDTAEVDRAHALTSRGWGELLIRCRRGDVKIVVPDVVIREAARHFGPAVHTQLAPSSRLVRMLNVLGVTDLPDLDAITEAIGEPAEFYAAHLRRRLESHGAVVAPVPEVSQEQILARDLAGRKPFRSGGKGQSGKGYRDTLIWETILELVRDLPEDEIIYFVTTNTDDFGKGKDGGLADDLEEDLVALGRPGSVEVVLTAGSQHLGPHLADHFDQIDTMIAESYETEGPADIARDAVIGQAESLTSDLTIGPNGSDADILIPRDIDDPTLEALDVAAETFDYWTYETYEGDTTSLGASVEVDATIHGYMAKPDWYVLDEDEDRMIQVMDSDWNEHYVWVEVLVRLRLSFQVLVVGESLEDISLDGVEVIPLDADEPDGPTIIG